MVHVCNFILFCEHRCRPRPIQYRTHVCNTLYSHLAIGPNSSNSHVHVLCNPTNESVPEMKRGNKWMIINDISGQADSFWGQSMQTVYTVMALPFNV